MNDVKVELSYLPTVEMAWESIPDEFDCCLSPKFVCIFVCENKEGSLEIPCYYPFNAEGGLDANMSCPWG